jgi:MFS family permease
MVSAAALRAATDHLPESIAGIGAGIFNLFFFIGGAIAVALAGAILRRRADAVEGWNPIFDGVAVAYSDAMLIVVALSLVAFLVTVVLRPAASKRAAEQELNPADEWITLAERDGDEPHVAAAGWALRPREKPVAGQRSTQRGPGAQRPSR